MHTQQALPSFARKYRAIYWLVLGLLTACASPHDYKFNDYEFNDSTNTYERVYDDAYKNHLKEKVKTCSFGRNKKGLYRGYHVRNHILEATKQGGIKYRAEGGAKNDFGLNFARIFNCYQNFHDWAVGNGKEFKQVLIYFNGGLNGASKVLKQAKRQVPIMLKDGYYPIFLLWPTGALDTYFEQTVYVRNGIRESNPVDLRGPLAFMGDFSEGLARSPVNYVNQLIRVTSSRNPFSDEDRREFLLEPKICRVEPEERPGAAGTTNCRDYEKTDVQKFGIENGKVTAERNLMTDPNPDKEPAWTFQDLAYLGLFATRFVSTPLVDAYGKTMWENMVRRTRTTIRRPIEYDIHFAVTLKPEQAWQIREDKRHFPHGIGAFAKFFTVLQRCISSRRSDGVNTTKFKDCIPEANYKAWRAWGDVELTVIGHSMGAIVMNELVPRHRKLPYRNLVFMAAAASVRDTARAMSPVVAAANSKAGRQNSGERPPLRFYNLMLHPQNDAQELVAYGAAPSGSLLAWIDEMYESPETVIDRTMGKWRNLRATKHVFPKEAQSNMLFRVFNRDAGWSEEHDADPRCHSSKRDGAADAKSVRFKPPTTHSGFNDCEALFWCPSFWGADKVGWSGRGTKWKARVCPTG